MLGELDSEFPEIDEEARSATRDKTIELLASLVADWASRGYSYAQIALKLREKGLIRVSAKALREASMPKKSRSKSKVKLDSRTTAKAGGAKADLVEKGAAQTRSTTTGKSASTPSNQRSERAGGFTPRDDSDDI